MKIIDEFLAGWREGRALREARKNEALLVTRCDNGHFFNARWQQGICPHSPAANFGVLECSRKWPHDGPCNGWPCPGVREKLGTPSGSGGKVEIH